MTLELRDETLDEQSFADRDLRDAVFTGCGRTVPSAPTRYTCAPSPRECSAEIGISMRFAWLPADVSTCPKRVPPWEPPRARELSPERTP